MNQLQEAYDQMARMNNEIMNYWRKVMSETPWIAGSQFSKGENWNPWLETMRSSYQMSLSSWHTIMDQSLEMFLESLKETRKYRQTLENQIRQNWEELKNAQQTQQERTREFFGNLASFLREDGESPQS